jgi:hypothetical protein
MVLAPAFELHVNRQEKVVDVAVPAAYVMASVIDQVF